jgi:hypothetical protein
MQPPGEDHHIPRYHPPQDLLQGRERTDLAPISARLGPGTDEKLRPFRERFRPVAGGTRRAEELAAATTFGGPRWAGRRGRGRTPGHLGDWSSPGPSPADPARSAVGLVEAGGIGRLRLGRLRSATRSNAVRFGPLFRRGIAVPVADALIRRTEVWHPKLRGLVWRYVTPTRVSGAPDLCDRGKVGRGRNSPQALRPPRTPNGRARTQAEQPRRCGIP